LPAFAGGHLSVAALQGYWYAVARSQALRAKPLAVVLLGTPIVVYRSGKGEVTALLDRCPHRNVPLSLGRVHGDGTLCCAYHGWQFRSDGSCTAIPGLLKPAHERLGRVPYFAAAERAGLIWVYAKPNTSPPEAVPNPSTPPNAAGYVRVVREVAVEATLHAAIENALDVLHTAFLHGGLFRGERKNRITATTTMSSDRVVTEYTGEPRPTGLAAKLLAPAGGFVQHWDRFILPSTAEVEYRIGNDVHFLVRAHFTPVSDCFTKLFAVVTFRTQLPGWLLRPILERVAMRIFNQDARMLKQQTYNIGRFGGEHFTNTELDMMGPAVWHLLRRAEAGALQEVAAHEQRVTEFES
jgi:phenylpropionate dioxygenase-like ring-hydroxylating dioxygenase large terminal subunit